MSQVYEIADNIYRIAAFAAPSPVTFAQFLIVDDDAFLFHTGPRSVFPETVEAIRTVIDPAKIRFISWSHLEADECGALNDFLHISPQAQPLAGEIATFLDVGDFFSKPIRGMKDNELLDLGRHRLRFLITPHVPHSWDAILVFDETTGTLLASDLFSHFGETVPFTESDIVDQALAVHRKVPEYLPFGAHTSKVFERLELLRPKVLAGHHAPSYTGNAIQALRDLRHGLFEISK